MTRDRWSLLRGLNRILWPIKFFFVERVQIALVKIGKVIEQMSIDEERDVLLKLIKHSVKRRLVLKQSIIEKQSS